MNTVDGYRTRVADASVLAAESWTAHESPDASLFELEAENLAQALAALNAGSYPSPENAVELERRISALESQALAWIKADRDYVLEPLEQARDLLANRLDHTVGKLDVSLCVGPLAAQACAYERARFMPTSSALARQFAGWPPWGSLTEKQQQAWVRHLRPRPRGSWAVWLVSWANALVFTQIVVLVVGQMIGGLLGLPNDAPAPIMRTTMALVCVFYAALFVGAKQPWRRALGRPNRDTLDPYQRLDTAVERALELGLDYTEPARLLTESLRRFDELRSFNPVRYAPDTSLYRYNVLGVIASFERLVAEETDNAVLAQELRVRTLPDSMKADR